MHGCEQIRRLIDAYLDGELSKGRCRRVEHHLFTCPGCQHYLESSRRVRQALEQETVSHAADPVLEVLWPRVEASLAGAGLRERVTPWGQRLRHAWENRRSSLRRALAGAGVAAVLLVLVLPHFHRLDRVRDEVVIESIGGESVTFVVSRFKETNTSIIWIVEPNG